MILPVILSGGSGTRLWPLSTPATPKQFLPLVGERTLFQETLARLDGLPGLLDPLVVCNATHGALVDAQLKALGISGAAMVLEPTGRNTAPAIGVAALAALDRAQALSTGSDPILLVLPADHVIADTAAFHGAIASAVEAAEAGRLVTFGIVPTHAETGFGYIETGTRHGSWSAVAQFKEKPDRATAEGYVSSGRFLWNSGMFVFRAGSFLAELERTAPVIHAACGRAVSAAGRQGEFMLLGPEFLESPSDSIDYAVMEKTDKAAVVPLDAGWSDVGSWAALHDAAPRDDSGNVRHGPVVAESCRDSYIWSSGRTVAAIGLEDVVIVETADAVLVMRKDQSQRVKDVSEAAARMRDAQSDSDGE